MSKTLGSLAVGAKIKDTNTKFLGSPIIWLKADSNHDGYPENSTTLITEKIIALRAVDAKEPNNTDSNRKSYGNNKYSVSNIDQWLNSDAAAGEWYTAKHDTDQAPNNTNVWNNNNEYDIDAGFLNGFSSLFKSKLLDTTLKVALNTVTDGGSYESIVRKVFFASRAEVFNAAENSIMEGSLLALFSANTNDCRKAYPTEECVTDSEYTSSSFNASSAWYWWLRTPSSSSSYIVRVVSSSGSLNGNYAYNGSYGVRPLCNLSSDTLVSDEVDSDGCYVVLTPPTAPTINIKTPVYCDPDYNTGGIEGGKAKITWSAVNAATYKLERSVNGGSYLIIYEGDSESYEDTISDNMNTIQYRVVATNSLGSSDYASTSVVVVQDNYPPFISGDDSAIGDVTTRIKYKYIVYDGDDATVTVKEYVNDTLIRTFTATGSQENTLEISLETWNALSIGDNYIKIVVTDDNNATVTQTKHFNKIGGIINVVYTPFGTNLTICPKAINVQLDLKKPLDATIQVLATNNANDTQPVWDDITTAALSGHNHIFSNTAKQSGVDYYAVKVKVLINRNNADGEIKLYGIKCQLDCAVN